MHLQLYYNTGLEYEQYHNTQNWGYSNDNIKLKQYVNEIKDAQQTEIVKEK